MTYSGPYLLEPLSHPTFLVLLLAPSIAPYQPSNPLTLLA